MIFIPQLNQYTEASPTEAAGTCIALSATQRQLHMCVSTNRMATLPSASGPHFFFQITEDQDMKLFQNLLSTCVVFDCRVPLERSGHTK